MDLWLRNNVETKRLEQTNPSAPTLITPPSANEERHHLVHRCFSQRRIETGYVGM